jgi:putative transposon-encoded protein
MYVRSLDYMVRRMKAVIMQIESVVTPSGNSGHIVVPKAWIGKEATVKLKKRRLEAQRRSNIMKRTLNRFTCRRKVKWIR